MSKHLAAVFLSTLMFCSLMISGCELDGLLDEFDDVPSCSTASGPVDVAGTWRLTGAGSRSGCVDSRFDGDFRIPEVELDVRQVPDPNNARVDQLELVVVPQVPNGTFTFDGSVNGTCVDFTTREDGSNGFFRFVFDGNQDGVDVGGEFTSEGPPGCVGSGEFRIVRE